MDNIWLEPCHHSNDRNHQKKCIQGPGRSREKRMNHFIIDRLDIARMIIRNDTKNGTYFLGLDLKRQQLIKISGNPPARRLSTVQYFQLPNLTPRKFRPIPLFAHSLEKVRTVQSSPIHRINLRIRRQNATTVCSTASLAFEVPEISDFPEMAARRSGPYGRLHR